MSISSNGSGQAPQLSAAARASAGRTPCAIGAAQRADTADRRGPAVAAGAPALWSRATVEAQIREAIATLMALPDRERDWLMSCRSRWPAAPGGAEGQARRRRPQPSPGAIDRMLPTLLWIRHLDEAGQRVLWMRGLGMSWARIGAEIGRSGQTARRWHDGALDLIAARLNRQMRQSPS
ncbi:DUF6362 family protein [Marinibaculum pumilum]|uniref:DUF6362 family protein n=1 Tax=Marinibaculum pumilum TaxID=1766165 RepID=A0ABV7L9X3_9PROT